MALGPFKPNSTEDCYEMYSDWYIYIFMDNIRLLQQKKNALFVNYSYFRSR